MKHWTILAFAFFSVSAGAALCGNFAAHEEYEVLSSRGMRLSSDPQTIVSDILNANKNTAVSGAWNLGVLTVASSNFRPPVALKFSNADYFAYDPLKRRRARLKQYVSVHRTLGYLRVAPQLRAILEADEVRRMLERPDVLSALRGRHGATLTQELGENWIGFAMDLLVDPHPLSRKLPMPYYITHWCEEHIVRALREMAEIRRRVMAAGVELNDQQLVVDPDAHIHLIDVDPYIFNPETSGLTRFTEEALYLINGWERMSGRTFNPAVRQQMLSELDVAHPVCTMSAHADMGEWRDQSQIICEERQRSWETAKSTVSSPREDDSSVAERAITIFPELQRRYLRQTALERVTWLTLLTGAGYAAFRFGLGKLSIALAILAPSPLNASENKDYFLTPHGFAELLQNSSPDFVRFRIHSDRRLAKMILETYGGLRP